MAIQGIFQADFSQFNSAVDAADGKLRQFTDSSNRSESSLRLVHGSSTRAGGAIGDLATGLSAADKTLGAFGVHIGPEIHALDELSQAAGKTASELGLIGSASLVAAAALGGIGIGRRIAEWTDADNKIAHLVDRVMGLGMAAQEAGAKQDSINLAISRGADATISYTQAIQFNTDWAAKSNERVREAAEVTKAHEKAMKDAKEAAEREAEAIQKLQKAHEDAIHAGADKLFGNDAVKAAQDYVEELGRVENVAVLSSAALQEVFDALTAGIDGMVRQGLAADDLTNQFEQFRLAVVAAQQTHTASTTQMESDEERLARESDELAKAMKENFVIIGQSAAEAAAKTKTSWDDAMAAVRAGQGTLGGSFQSVAPGAAGSSIRYDDYGNPYGYIPGVNQPGKLTPTGGNSIFVDARESIFDTPAGMQRLADKVVTALGTRSASRGGR